MKELKEYFAFARRIISFCKSIPFIRLMKFARIFACVLLVFAWSSAHVINLHHFLRSPAILQLLQQLVSPVTIRAKLHESFGYMLLLFILTATKPQIHPSIAWEVRQTAYEIGEFVSSIYILMYAIYVNIEFVYFHCSPDTQVFVIAIIYLSACIATQIYHANMRIKAEVEKNFALHRSTGYVDDTGREIYEDDTVLVHSQLYTVVRLLPDKKYYLCRVGTGIITTPRNHCTNTYQDVIALEDVFAAKIPIRIYDKDKKMPEK